MQEIAVEMLRDHEMNVVFFDPISGAWKEEEPWFAMAFGNKTAWTYREMVEKKIVLESRGKTNQLKKKRKTHMKYFFRNQYQNSSSSIHTQKKTYFI